MFTSLSTSSARSELWAAGRISRPPRVFVCMHIYAIDEFTSLPLRWLNLPLSIVTAPLPHLHAHPRDASLNLWPSVCEPLRLGSSSNTYHTCSWPVLVRFSAFLHFCVYATDPPLHDLIIICLCYSASSTSFTYTAGLWSWHEGWWWLLLLITEPRWDLICRLSAWHPLTKVSDELFIFLLVTLICFCCVVVLHCYAIKMLNWLWICGSEQCSIIIIIIIL